jgi:hypothetical protein
LKAQHVSSGIPLIIRSSKLYLPPLDYIFMWWPAVVQVPTQPGQRPVTTWVYKPEVANTVWSSWWWAVCRSKHVEPSINFGIIISITRLHLVGYFCWFILRCTDPWKLYFDDICNTFCREHLPEDVHNKWPKHVAGYAVYSTINFHICICTCWSYIFIKERDYFTTLPQLLTYDKI